MSSGPAIDERISPPKRRRAWIPPFGVWRYAIVGIILLTPFFVRVWFLWNVPEIAVPFDVDEFRYVEIPKGQNAFEYYRRAQRMSESIDADRASRNAEPYDPANAAVYTDGWSKATESLKVWIEDYRPAALEWRRGTEMSQAQDDEWLLILDQPLTPFIFSSLRQFSRYAVFEGARLEAVGDYAEAASWCVAILRCRHHGTGDSLIHRLVGSAIYGMGVEHLIQWSEIPEVRADQIRTVLRMVNDADRLIVPLSATLKSEYLWADRSLNGPSWWGAIDFKRHCGTSIADYILSADPEYSPTPFAVRAFLWTVGEPLKTQRRLRHALANQLPEIDKPLRACRPTIETVTALLFSPDPNDSQKSSLLDADKIERANQSSVVLESFPQYSITLDGLFLRDRAEQSMLEIVLAAQIYFREHGEFPDDPELLVSSYLDNWPVDACDKSGQSIRYRRDDAVSAVIWSVGRNGNDDAGDIGAENFGFNTPDCGIRIKAR